MTYITLAADYGLFARQPKQQGAQLTWIGSPAILGIQKSPGVMGEYNFDGNGGALDSYHVMQNDQGTLKLLKTLRVAQ